MNDFELRRHLRALPSERAPARDLWPEIAAGLAAAPRAPAPQRRRRLPVALAAAAALVAVMSTALLRVGEGPIDASGPVHADASGIDDPGVLRDAAAMRFEYRVAIAQLADTPLPAELRPAARELKETEAMLREALLEHPDSTLLLSQLRRTYEHQLRLSQRASFG